MTFSTTTNRVSYSGDDSTVAFTIPFLFLANGHIVATLRDSAGVETTWTLDTQYSLAGVLDAAGGTLTVKTSPTDYTPATGETLVIQRIVPQTQATDYPEGGAFPASAHETAIDKLTMLVQQLSEEIGRRLSFPLSDSSSLSAELPNSSDRASARLGFDSDGEPVIITTDVTGVAATAFGASLVDDTNAAAGRTTLAVVIGTDVQAFDADTLKADTDDTLTAGFAGTDDDDGTKSTGTYTPTTAGGNFKKIVHGAGAFTLAPQSLTSTIIIEMTNASASGSITTSGFTIVSGDATDNTGTNKFMLYSTVVNSLSHLHVKALQ